MIKKAFFILAIIFVVKLLVSCCRCDDYGTYEVDYNAVDVTAYNTAGFTTQEVTDSVYKYAFGLGIYMVQERILSNTNPSFNLLGFSSIMACSCPEDIYEYPDPLDYILILATDTETEIITDVTSTFRILSGNYEYISLEQFFNERADWHDGFEFQLVDVDTIPSSAIFTVQAYLESGTMFSELTQQINFKD